MNRIKLLHPGSDLLVFSLCAVLSVALCGCSLFVEEPAPVEEQQAELEVIPEEPIPTPDPRPRLAVARNDQISLFGELPDNPEVPYFTRTATSLLQHTFAGEGADFDTYISPDGKWMIFASTRHNKNPDIYYKAVQGVAVTQLTSDPAADVQPIYSPDRTKVAFASNRTGNWDIWIIGLDGQRPVQITSSLAHDVHPSWSPDGAKLVYCSLPTNGQWELWVADASTGGKKQFIGYGLFPEWSPAGNTIAYQRARERGSRWFSIWTLELVGDEPRYPTEVAASSEASLITPSWNRTGTKLSYAAVLPTTETDLTTGEISGKSDIWIVNVDGSNKLRLTDGHTSNFGPVWAPDGRVFFTSSREGHETVWSLMPVGSEVEPSGVTASAEPAQQKPAKAQTASWPQQHGNRQ